MGRNQPGDTADRVANGTCEWEPSGASLARPLSRRRLLQGAGALATAVVLGEACSPNMVIPRPSASPGGQLLRSAPVPSPSPTPGPVLTADALLTAVGDLAATGTLALPGGGSATVADLSAAGVAFAIAGPQVPRLDRNPLAALGLALAAADWSGQTGAVDLAGALPKLPLTPVRLVLPQLPGGQTTDTLGAAVPAGLTLRPGTALLLAGVLADGRIVAGMADPARTVAGHPRLELAVLTTATLTPLLNLAGASLDPAGTSLTLSGGTHVLLTPIDPALAARLVAGAGVLFVDQVPLQPKGAKTPLLTADPIVPAPDASLAPGFALVSQAKDGRILALDSAGKAIGRAQHIGGTTPWRWQGTEGLDWSLRELADAAGVRIGCAPGGWLVVSDSRYAAVVDREFNAENLAGPGWVDLQPRRDAPLELGYWDTRIARAGAANMPLLGNLLFNASDDVPKWLDVKPVTTAELSRAARQLVTEEVARLPAVATWNVFNEPIATVLYGSKLTGTFSKPFGAGFHGFIADALGWAHDANPAATLIINEDYNDGRSPAITHGFLGLVRELLDRGAPLGAIGMEMHLHYDESGSDSGFVFTPARFAAALAPYRKLGLPVIVTEFDVDMTGFPGSKAHEQQVQATFYRDALQAALDGGVRDFYVFGLTDNTSWWLQVGRPKADALMFDANYQPKPAYFAVRDVLKQRAGLT